MSSRLCTASLHPNLTQRFAFIPRRYYAKKFERIDPQFPDVKEVPLAVDASKVNLPPSEEWRKHFPMPVHVNHRVSIRNAETAARIAEAFVPAGSRDKVVIEAFPGPGQLTRALLNLPKGRIKRLIVMEYWESYLQYLRESELQDPRITVINQDGHAWSTYQLIHSMGLLDDVPTIGWEEGVHPNLHFISHFPSTVMGEQLVAQLFRAIPEKQWLFKYGRVPLSFLLSSHVHDRVSATVKDPKRRCKVSVVTEAVAKWTDAVPYDSLQPYEDHFHPKRPPIMGAGDARKKDNRGLGNPFRTMNVIPLEEQIIEKGKMDAWDFCLRRLFVRKATPLKEALPGIAPGAGTLLKIVTDQNLPSSERLDVKKPIRLMTAKEWGILLKAFDEWPFAPQDLSIGETFGSKERM